MRLIDADTLIKKLQDDYHGMISDEGMKIYQIIRMLSEAPIAQSGQATIYDFCKMCKHYICCEGCPLSDGLGGCINGATTKEALDKASDIILRWKLEHPAKTRQDVFLEQYPEATLVGGVLLINPCYLGKQYYAKYSAICDSDCARCRREYWLGEAE